MPAMSSLSERSPWLVGGLLPNQTEAWCELISEDSFAWEDRQGNSQTCWEEVQNYRSYLTFEADEVLHRPWIYVRLCGEEGNTYVLSEESLGAWRVTGLSETYEEIEVDGSTWVVSEYNEQAVQIDSTSGSFTLTDY